MSRWLTIVAVLSAVAMSARAQDVVFPLDDFNANRFYVAPGPDNFVIVDGAGVGPDLEPSFGATLSYQHRPYAADDLDWFIGCEQGTRIADCNVVPTPTLETDLLGPLLTLQLYGAFTFLERVQIGLALPIVLFAEGDEYTFQLRRSGGDVVQTAAPGGAVGGLGDPRISAKIRLLDPDAQGNGVTMAAMFFLNVPVGHYIQPRHFLGDRSPQVGGRLIGGFRFEGFRLALNLGFTFREEQTNVRSAVGPELMVGLAAAYRFHPFAEAIFEYTAWTSFGQRFDSEAPMDIRLVGVVHTGLVSIHVGASLGLVYGVGLPVASGFAGVTYAPRPDPDSDGDGIVDSLDGCPGDAEDMDSFDDEDGCPDEDNDEDSIPDADDPCPDQAEDVDEHEDQDGCPEEDNDGDGIIDGYDSCPNTPEDMDGDRDTDGCPDQDQDGDGLDEEADQCPTEAEDFDGFADGDGCPETDVDGDGIPDETDECPEQAEDVDRFQDQDGCPEEGGPPAGRQQRGR